MFKKGEKVIQVVPAPIVGTVAGFDVDQETGVVLPRVEWTDADGVVHSRHFNANELQSAPVEA
jgi:hypothetical protein